MNELYTNSMVRGGLKQMDSKRRTAHWDGVFMITKKCRTMECKANIARRFERKAMVRWEDTPFAIE